MHCAYGEYAKGTTDGDASSLLTELRHPDVVPLSDSTICPLSEEEYSSGSHAAGASHSGARKPAIQALERIADDLTALDRFEAFGLPRNECLVRTLGVADKCSNKTCRRFTNDPESC